MAVSTFHLTHDQERALMLLGGDQVHTMLFGGSRSGKTFLIVRTIIIRAMKVPKSRHLMARFRLTDIQASIILETWPKVIDLCFPELRYEIEPKMADRYFLMPNGSEIWWAGLDDKERTEKALGKEYATVFLNECSQIPWASRNLIMSRLAQKTWRPHPDDPTGDLGLPRLPGLRIKAYYDENPPLKTHWTHKLFIERKSPDTNKLLGNPMNYNCMLLNPAGNKENLDEGYLRELDELPDRLRKRFRDGRFGEAGEGALWTEELLEQQLIRNEADLPEFQRIVIGVDPSGSRDVDDMHRDEIGIVVVGLGTDGKGYVLEDLTMRGSPADWGKAVCQAYQRWGADRVVAETNFGGAMVAFVIQSAAGDIAREQGVPFRVAYTEVTASRGKVVRAEPISALYEQQSVWHVEGLTLLEAEMVNMTVAGYLGDRSPNRVDACLVGASMVATHRGEVRLDQVMVGDMALTRKGWRRVLASAMTKPSAQTFTVALSDGRALTGTSEHPVFIRGKGFVRIDALVCGDMVEPIEDWQCSPQMDTQSRWNWTEWCTRAIRAASAAARASITSAITISTIASSGNGTTARSRLDGMSTTKIGTHSTTRSTILSRCPQAIIHGSISRKPNDKRRATTSMLSDRSPVHGMAARLGWSGIVSMVSALGKIANQTSSAIARGAVSRWSHTLMIPASAPAIAGVEPPIVSIGSRLKWPARSAVGHSGRTATGLSRRPAPVSVVRVSVASVEPVYNLEVEGEHEYFANGVLVHNCVWALTALFHAVVKASRENASSRGTAPPKVNLGHAALKQRMAYRGRR